MSDVQLYRNTTEVEAWRPKGPIFRVRTRSLGAGLIHGRDVTDPEPQIDDEIVEAVAFAERVDLEPVKRLTRHVVAETWPASSPRGATR